MNCFKLAIFDLDGVLTETSEQHYQAWKSLADELEIEFDKAFNEHLKGISRMESLERILVRGNAADKYSDEEKRVLAARKNDIYRSLIENFTPDHLHEGVRELFDGIKAMGAKIALASASKNAPMLLTKMAIYNNFDCIVDPSSVEKGKPDPGIFLKAAEMLGIDSKDCVGFEDAFAGIQSIKSAGMYAVGIGDADLLHDADEIYPHIREVKL